MWPNVRGCELSARFTDTSHAALSEHSTGTAGTSTLQPASAHIPPSLAAGPLTLVGMSEDQRDLPTSRADPARVPHVLHSHSRMASHSTTQYLAALQNRPPAFCPPNSYPVASQVPVDFPSTADRLQKPEKNHMALITAALLALSLS